MKRKLLIAAMILLVNIGNAQLTTNLVMSPQPPGTLLNWGVKDLTFVVTNQSGAPRRVIIKASFKLTDGTVIGSTNLSKAKTLLIAGGNLILHAPEVIPMETMVFTGKYKSSLDKTGKLPADNYMLCVQLVTPVDFQPVSEEKCKNFLLAAYQLPIAIMPPNQEVMDAVASQTAITFRWTPVAPLPGEPVYYIVTVFEVLNNQSPMQALRSNQPLLTKEVIGTTQFIWQPQLSFSAAPPKSIVVSSGDPHENKALDSISVSTFIWTIQTVDSRHVPFGDGNVNADGISEPNTFYIITDNRKLKTGPPARVIYEEYLRKLPRESSPPFPPVQKD